jgi:hypothetical protein
MVACEGPAGPIRSVHAGRKAHDQEPWVGIAESGHRRGVIVGVRSTHLFSQPGEARAQTACRIKARVALSQDAHL